MGIDPPKWHDVGGLLIEHTDLLSPGVREDVPELARISKWLRKEREFAFYGDIDFIPTEEYTLSDAQRAQVFRTRNPHLTCSLVGYFQNVIQ